MQIHSILIPIGHFRLVTFPRHIIRILGRNRGFRLQRIGLPFFVHRSNAELILVPLLQILYSRMCVRSSPARHPTTGGGVELLDLVVIDRQTAVVLRRLPVEVHMVGVDVRNFERSDRRRGLADDVDHHTMLVGAAVVCGG